MQRKFSIDADAQAKLRVLANKTLELINQYKQRYIASASSSESPLSYLTDLRKYINRQRDNRLYIGTVRAIDHKLDEHRNFRVYLSASTGAGGYFDDYLTAEFLEYVKLLADERGIEAASRKHRLKKSIVQYAHETPVKDLRDIRGRGDIVINVDEIIATDALPRIMDLLTHELTHGVQMDAAPSELYNQAAAKIHQGEELTRDERHAYYRERTEFEAQLNGLLERMRTKYSELNNRDVALSALMKQEDTKDLDIEELESHVDAYIRKQKLKYRNSYQINLAQLPKKTAQEIDTDVFKIERRFIELRDDIHRNGEQLDMIDQQLDDVIAQAHVARDNCNTGDQSSCDRFAELKRIYKKLSVDRDALFETNKQLHAQNQQLKAKYYVLGSVSSDFIASIAGDKNLWVEFKRAVRDFIASLD